MDLRQAKIYNDGSHYIAIRRTTRKNHPKRLKKERLVVVDAQDIVLQETDSCKNLDDGEIFVETNDNNDSGQECKETVKSGVKPKELPLKEVFNIVYMQTVNVSKKYRRKTVQDAMRKYFDDDKSCYEYVQTNFERIERNFLCRKIRLMRKINLYDFNYFVTYTYDDGLHTEETFKKKLKRYLHNMTARYEWRYIGVWERSPEKQRLHYHGLFIIPDISIVGELKEKKDYNVRTRRMQIVRQSEKILKKFGRNDFREINSEYTGGEALNYLLKYIEKTGSKLDSSGKLPAYIIGDVLPEDIMCQYGENENKFVLADNFMCIDQGEILGEVSQETIKLMTKEN